MTENMVERVAEAIYDAQWAAGAVTWSMAVERSQRDGYGFAKDAVSKAREVARAAIEVMREPAFKAAHEDRFKLFVRFYQHRPFEEQGELE